jgi:hypothetical protein
MKCSYGTDDRPTRGSGDMPLQHIDFIGEIQLREATVATGVCYGYIPFPTSRHMQRVPVAEVAAVAIQQNQWVRRLPHGYRNRLRGI